LISFSSLSFEYFFFAKVIKFLERKFFYIFRDILHPTLRDLGRGVIRCRKLKHTVNKVSSLVSLPPETTRIDFRANVVFLPEIEKEYRDNHPKVSTHYTAPKK
jgi:hypothetical protein